MHRSRFPAAGTFYPRQNQFAIATLSTLPLNNYLLRAVKNALQHFARNAAPFHFIKRMVG
jgi:hypothetical protein